MHNPCPHETALADWLDGTLAFDARETIELHISECLTCEQTADRLVGMLLPALAELDSPAPDDAFESEKQLDNAISQIEKLVERSGNDDNKTIPFIPRRRIRSCELESLLGSGGMGDVYSAYHHDLGCRVAIKLLPAHRLNSARAVKRFRREQKALGALNHPNIVRAVDAGEEDGLHFLAMELVEGVGVDKLAKRASRVSTSDICEIIRQAAIGLQYAHERGLVHRDIKPSNLIIDRAGTVKLLDLGLATFREGDGQMALTKHDQLMGSIDYMAPEQGVSNCEADIRSDIFSLGATLFRLLTGTTLFADKSSTVEKLNALAHAPIPQVKQFRPDLPSELTVVVNRMLNRDRHQRFDQPIDVAAALAGFCTTANLSQLANEESDTTNQLDNQSTSLMNRERQPTRVDGSPRRPIRWLATVCLALLLLALGVTITLSTDGGKIVVHCSDPTVELEIVRNDQPVEQWAAGQLADYMWFRSGNYEIRIPSHGQDRFIVRNGKFKLNRNDRRVVTIELKMETAKHAAMRSQAPAGMSPATGVTDDKWLGRTFTLNGVDFDGVATGYLACNIDGSLAYNRRNPEQWRMLPHSDGWVIQHFETGRVLTAVSATMVDLRKYDGNFNQRWIRKQVTFAKTYWAFQNKARKKWLWADSSIRLVSEAAIFSDASVQVAGVLDISPKFSPLYPELQNIWAFDKSQSNFEDRSVDVLTSEEWKWTEPQPLGDAINDGIDANIPASPSLTPDGLKMLFGWYESGLYWHWFLASRESLNQEFAIQTEIPALPRDNVLDRFLCTYASVVAGSGPNHNGDSELYAYELTEAGEWRDTQMFANVNSVYHDDEVSLSADGLTAVFASRRPEGLGDMDIWMATRISTEVPFDQPTHLGNGINSTARDASPALSQDGLVLIFCTKDRPEQGKLQLWMACRQSTVDNFDNPQPLLLGNSQLSQSDPALALNGKVLVFRQFTPDYSQHKLYYSNRVRR